MSNRPLVSVIIPVYNVEKYLKECLDSVINQSYNNLEIIVVNDNSPDGSGEIANRYSKKDARVKLIHKQMNEGLNYARRDGFKKSTGEYVAFLDSDDLLHQRSIEIYVQAFSENKTDVVVAGFFDFSDDSKDIHQLVSSVEDMGEARLLSSKKAIMRYALLGDPTFPDANYMTACGKLYSRKLIEGIDWSKSNFRSYEDNFWTPQVLMHADRVALITNKLYFYRRDVSHTSGGSTLGNRLTGNTYNGEPVGYLEYISLLRQFYEKLSQKYDIKIDDELQELYYQRSWNRLCVLIDAEQLDMENNLQYVKDIWRVHQQKDWQLQQHNIELSNLLEESSNQIERLQRDANSIKRTARRLLRNIKRKFL